MASFGLFSLLSLSLFQLFTRNLFDFGYPEIEVINRNLLVFCGMMGAVLATPNLRHIKIDALTPLLKPRHIEILKAPLALFSAAVCLLMCYYSSIFVLDEWEFAPVNERWALPFTLIYPVGFLLLSIHFLLMIFKRRQQ